MRGVHLHTVVTRHTSKLGDPTAVPPPLLPLLCLEGGIGHKENLQEKEGHQARILRHYVVIIWETWAPR